MRTAPPQQRVAHRRDVLAPRARCPRADDEDSRHARRITRARDAHEQPRRLVRHGPRHYHRRYVPGRVGARLALDRRRDVLVERRRRCEARPPLGTGSPSPTRESHHGPPASANTRSSSRPTTDGLRPCWARSLQPRRASRRRRQCWHGGPSASWTWRPGLLTRRRPRSNQPFPRPSVATCCSPR